MARTAVDRAALAAKFSSSPEAEREPAAAAGPSQIRSVVFTTKLPVGRHHAFSKWLAEEAFTLGVAPKWVGLQAGIEELVGLLLTNERVARELHDALAERVRGQ